MPTLHTAPLNRLFQMAVVAGVESAVKIHIQRGDDLNARDGNGLTPLMLAAMRNKSSVCSLLLSSGADPALLDPNGNDALAHARQAGADAAAVTIQSAINLTRFENPKSRTSDEKTLAPSGISQIVAMDGMADNTLAQPNTSTKLSAAVPTPPVGIDQPAGQLTDWEPEVAPRHGADNPILAKGAATVQIAISNHTPFDSSADWDDLDVYLPITSAPLRRGDDAETKATLRLLLLRAIREGSVPDMDVVDAATNDNRTENEEFEALLRMVLNDLGAETDERFEYSEGDDHFEVITSLEESPDEEEIVSDAIAFIDAHESNRHDPLRLYQREFQRERLITAEEEVSIAKSMERAISNAIDALAAWPQGVTHVIACAELVKSGVKPIQWLSGGARDDAPEDINLLESTEAINVLPEVDDLGVESPLDHEDQPIESESVDFFDRMAVLSKMGRGAVQSDTRRNDVRATLASLSLKSAFLLGMVDLAREDGSTQAALFASAMGAYQHARDRMAIANVKLVASIAKKFLYTGMQLEDIIQDGNVGLLKAVEKYEWRKGFRFSTYATWWIQQSMHRSASDTSRTIRLPVLVYDAAQRLLRSSAVFERANGRAPTKNEVAESMALPLDKATALMRIAQDTTFIDEETIDDLITPSSISEYSTPDPFDVVAAADLRGALDLVLAELDRKQERIVRLRFGFGVSEAFTLDEIGIRYGVTRERIRQIESKALRILKHPHRAEKLHNMLYGSHQMVPATRQVEPEANEDDLDQEFNDSRPPSTISTLNCPIATSRDIPTKRQAGRPSTFHRLMTQALEMGVEVTMDRESASGTTWVDIKETTDNRHRKLIRKLLAIGFKHWPGKGYWR